MKEKFKSFLCKISETTKKVGRKLKKGEIGLYAIALMLVAAGYYNYKTFEPETTETYSEDIANISSEETYSENIANINSEETYSEDIANISSENTNIGDAVLVSNNEEAIEEEPETTEEIGEEDNDDDYYANTKLERNQMYAEMITNYENILNNSNVSEVQKSIATEEIRKINATRNAIMICENLILTKGFENCAILVNDASVNIMVSIEGGLTPEYVAKIQNIVSRELNTKVEDIHIIEI